MRFLETVRQVRDHLQHAGRVSLKALKLEFALDDNALEQLIEELVQVQCVATQEGGILAWAGEPRPPAQPVESPAERDPRDYTPKHLADKILQSKSALEGERKQVTVLFADVKGSMELAGQVDPEEWHGILDRFFQILADGVHRFEGTVNQYTGDGIMALFGAPIAHEDHAQRACYAALYLRDTLKGYADELRMERGLNFSVRMGLNSGEVVVGSIGDDLRMDYTAQGQVVNLAQRMEELADSGKALLTQHTAKLVEGYFALHDLGQTRVRGVAEPLGVAELESPGPQRTRLDRSRARGFSRFVGRERELKTLQNALEQALAGTGRVVGVVGDAGTGKSRLCDEFVEGCQARGTRVLDAHCPAHGKSVAFLPVLELLRGYFGIEEQDGDRDARRKIAGELTLLDPEFQEMLPLVFEFLGVPDPQRPVPLLAPEVRQRRLFAFVRHLTKAHSERESAVIFIDDLHWIDTGSDAFLAQLVDVAATTRTLVLVNFRPEYRAEWMQLSHYQQIPLGPFDISEVRELLGDLLGDDPSLAGLPERLYDRTGGNPFFIEEIVQSLVENGHLEGARGARRLAASIDALEIPPTVQAVLAARIDRVPEREKRLLQVASVIGRDVPERLLAEVSECSAGELAESLAALQRAELLLQRTLYPDPEYFFKHALTQDVAYGSQLGERRARTHAAVARAIEAKDPEGLDEQAGLLAQHWESAGDSTQAARWHARAAERVGLANVNQAIEHWERVRELAQEVPDSPVVEELALEACRGLLRARMRRPRSEEEIEQIFREGCALADRRQDRGRRAALLESYVGARMVLGTTLQEMQPLFDEALQVAVESQDTELEIAVMYRRVWAFMMESRHVEQVGLSRELEERVQANPGLGSRLLGFDPALRLRPMRILAEASTGLGSPDLDESERYVERAHRARDHESELGVSIYGASVARLRGDVSRALALGRRAENLARESGGEVWLAMALLEQGLAHLEQQDWDSACAAFHEAGRPVGAGEAAIHAAAMAGLALARAHRGDLEGAREATDASARLLRTVKTLIWARPLVHLFRTRLLLETEGANARAEIENEIEATNSAFEANGMYAYLPLVHVQRARLAEVLGDEATHERELREAHRMFVELGATGHAERLARELGP